ncbi:alpha-L-arabinofuranosidase [Parapedobacter tibetensis]|uniref:alpha-L-arabinofuranosidase n=1 Tax=Parapedobacter tibetensis TaxID=2972951 RepID=UPI00214DAE2A|nr:alpha-L-arabinofuranosidase [Parapedobacter tibetensis]
MINSTAIYRNGIALLVGASLLACSKKNQTVEMGNETVKPPTEVGIPASVGFFMDDWAPRQFMAPAYVPTTAPILGSTITVTADYSETISRVNPSIFGTNTNLYIGQMVDQPVLLNHLQALSPGIIRFPGGNLSSIYFWNANNGQMPMDVPATLYDTGGNPTQAFYWYGKNTDSWTLSLANYYQMLQQTNTKGMITINYGYARYGLSDDPVAAAAHLAAEWVRHDDGRTSYWEIGNESSGPWQAGFKIDVNDNKDGQPEIINGTVYGQHFKVYADSMRKAAIEVGATIKIGAQLMHYDAANSWNVPDRTWNEEYFAAAGDEADYYIIHDYYTPLGANTGAADILQSAVSGTRSMMQWMHTSTQRAGVAMKPIALTEWNIGAEGSRQMVSHIAGMHATMVLGEFIKHNYGMAARWGIANGYANGNDHGMFSLGDEGDGTAKWTPRPAFYYMYYFQKYVGDRMFATTVSGSDEVLAYAAGFSSDDASMVLVNIGTEAKVTSVDIKNFKPGSRYYYYSLVGGEGGTFSRQVLINRQGPEGLSGGPTNYDSVKALSAPLNGVIKLELPPRSVVYLMVDGA